MNDRYVVIECDQNMLSKEQTHDLLLDYVHKNPHMLSLPLYIDVSIRAFSQTKRVISKVIGKTDWNFIIDNNPFPDQQTCSLVVDYSEDNYVWYGESLVPKRYPDFLHMYRYQDFIHQVFFKKEDIKNKLVKQALSKGDIL